MKKVLFVFAIATSLVACNNADTTKAAEGDTTKKDTVAAPAAVDTTKKDTVATPVADTTKKDTTVKAH